MKDKGPNENYEPGLVIRVDDVRAKILVKRGHAEYFEEKTTSKETEVKKDGTGTNKRTSKRTGNTDGSKKSSASR